MYKKTKTKTTIPKPKSKKQKKAKKQEPTKLQNSNRSYIISNTHLDIYEDKKLILQIPLDTLKPRILHRAKAYSMSFKRFEQEVSKDNINVDYWMALIFNEYNIDMTLSNKDKYCKLRKLTGNCKVGINECRECED